MEPDKDGVIRVKLPKADVDIELEFPGGKKLLIQARPSNGDEGYAGSLDIILPESQAVALFVDDDMKPAPPTTSDGRYGEHQRRVKHLWGELPATPADYDQTGEHPGHRIEWDRDRQE